MEKVMIINAETEVEYKKTTDTSWKKWMGVDVMPTLLARITSIEVDGEDVEIDTPKLYLMDGQVDEWTFYLRMTGEWEEDRKISFNDAKRMPLDGDWFVADMDEVCFESLLDKYKLEHEIEDVQYITRSKNPMSGCVEYLDEEDGKWHLYGI